MKFTSTQPLKTIEPFDLLNIHNINMQFIRVHLLLEEDKDITSVGLMQRHV